ncbi:hypothetical protein [Microcella sp.]|uniref:hypothetical protein n=1 Tax=Microcella sp. TaxID=1913979 RepID=UPI00255FACAB|nr:hypothetical protein [Microcella sp.]MBX9470588.1 hypothetical protein [Microcella sp.]
MRVRLVAVAGCSLAVALTAGCASAAAPAVTAHDVLLERELAAEAQSRAVFDSFLDENADRLNELQLPRPEFQGVVEPERWGEAVIGCVESLDTDVRVSRQEGGFGVNYFGLPDGAYDRIRWTIESCMVQYGLLAELPPPGPVEVAWLEHDVVQRLLPCLRGLGVSTPPAPTAEAVRAAALCPPSDDELRRQLELVAGEQ